MESTFIFERYIRIFMDEIRYWDLPQNKSKDQDRRMSRIRDEVNVSNELIMGAPLGLLEEEECFISYIGLFTL